MNEHDTKLLSEAIAFTKSVTFLDTQEEIELYTNAIYLALKWEESLNCPINPP